MTIDTQLPILRIGTTAVPTTRERDVFRPMSEMESSFRPDIRTLTAGTTSRLSCLLFVLPTTPKPLVLRKKKKRSQAK